jgi:hypothetical protein
MPVLNRIQIRRGTAAAGSSQWTNEVLFSGEFGYETDTGKFKIGDGITQWSSLSYASILPSELTELVQDIIGANVVAGSGISISYNDTSGNTTVSLNGSTSVKVSDITDLTASAAELNILDGATLSTAELNILTGIKSSTAELNYLSGITVGSGSASKAVILDSNKDLQGIRNLTLDGDLTVNGTATTVNSVTMTVDDKNLELGSVANPTDSLADGGGITLKGSDDIEWKWLNASQSWTSSENINLNSATLVYKINNTTVLGNSTIGASGYSLASGVIVDGGTP